MDSQQAVFLAHYLTGLWEGESAATAKVLAAVPDGNKDYRPDPKSRTLWEVATHLATSDVWFLLAVCDGKFVWDPEAAKQAESALTTTAGLVEFYQREFAAGLARVRALPPEKLTQVTDFFGLFQWPSVQYLGFGNNHSMHHRGQLAAYLRAAGSKVPAIYGGSADEPMQG
jgi:uncharacterized damage-inducible protein DinB